MLDILKEIDDPTVLREISQSLDASVTVLGGVPSGVEPQRRVADVAVDAFIKRLKLPVSFETNTSRRYSEENITEVKNLINSAIPH